MLLPRRGIIAAGLLIAAVLMLIFLRGRNEPSEQEERSTIAAYPERTKSYQRQKALPTRWQEEDDQSSAPRPAGFAQSALYTPQEQGAFYDSLNLAYERGKEQGAAFLIESLRREEEKTIAWLAGHEGGVVDYEEIRTILKEYFQNGPGLRAFLSYFDLLDQNETLAAPLLAPVIIGFYQTEPEAATKWLGRHPELSGMGNALQEVGAAIGSQDEPAGEIDRFLASHEHSQSHQKFLTGAMSAWAQRDLSAAFSYLAERQSLPEFDEALYNMVGLAAQSDGVTAMEWAEQIADPQFALLGKYEVARHWIKEDQRSFQEWFAQQPSSTQEFLRMNLD